MWILTKIGFYYEEFWSLLYNAHFSHRPRRE